MQSQFPVVYLAKDVVTTQALLAYATKHPLAHAVWVTYDFRAEFLLRQNNIYSYYQDDLLTDQVVKKIDAEAYDLTAHWIQDAPSRRQDSSPIVIEAVRHREVNYVMQAVVRGYYLLKAIQERFPSAKIITIKNPQYKKLSWEEDECALDGWLLKTPAFSFTEVEWLPAIPHKEPKSDSRSCWRSTPLTNFIFSAFFRLYSLLPHPQRQILYHGNPNILKPVLKELVDLGYRSSEVRWINNSRSAVRAIRNSSLALGRVLSSSNESIEPPPRKEQALFLEGHNIYPILRDKFDDYYQQRFMKDKKEYADLKVKLRKSKPNLILLDEDVTYEGSLIAITAKELRIPVIVLLHGIPTKKLGFAPFKSTRLLAWGREDIRMLTSWGIPQERICVAGCPKYDHFQNTRPLERLSLRRKILKRFHIPTNGKIILVAPMSFSMNSLIRFEGLVSNAQEIFRWIIHFVKLAHEFPRHLIVFKFHGSAKEKNLLNYALRELGYEKASPNIHWIEGGPATELIEGADLIASVGSSLVYEAILKKKPLIFPNFSKHDYPQIYWQYANLPQIRDYENLRHWAQALTNWTEEDIQSLVHEQNKLIEPFLTSNTKKAAPKIAKLVLEEISNTSSSLKSLEQGIEACTS